MQTWLVTGANGFLGAEIVRRLAAEARVVAIGGTRATGGVRPVDLRDAEAPRRLVAEARPNAVVLCAAYRDPDWCEEHPDDTRRLNVDSVQGFCKALPGDVPVLFISSDYVFDGLSPPYREDHPRRPVNLYGQTKLEAEDHVLQRARGVVVRIPVLIGPRPPDGPPGFLDLMARDLHSKVEAMADDTLIRFPTSISDVAEAIVFLLSGNHRGVFHVSGARGGTRYMWTLEMARVLGLPSARIHRAPASPPRKAVRPPNSALSTEKIRALGFNRFTDFTDVVRAWSQPSGN